MFSPLFALLWVTYNLVTCMCVCCFRSEMSWSDCLEIGLKSSKSGYQTYAKYWMETALSKIPQVVGQQSDVAEDKENNTTTTSTSQTAKEYNIKARIEVMRALLNVEYKAGKNCAKSSFALPHDLRLPSPKLKSNMKHKL